MSGIATAIVGGAVISGVVGSSSADKAAKAQGQASDATIAEQQRQFDLTQESLRPFQEAGVSALEQQRILLGLGSPSVDPNAERRAELEAKIAQHQDPSRGQGGLGAVFDSDRIQALNQEKVAGLQAELSALPVHQQGPSASEQQSQAFEALSQSPGQQFLQQRAQKNLLRNAAAMGGLGGGNVREALVQQGVGFAQQDLQNQFGRLGQLAGQGQAAATQVGQFGQQTSGNIGNALISGGNARASGILGQNQAFQNTLSGIGTGIGMTGGFGGGGTTLPAQNINPFARTV